MNMISLEKGQTYSLKDLGYTHQEGRRCLEKKKDSRFTIEPCLAEWSFPYIIYDAQLKNKSYVGKKVRGGIEVTSIVVIDRAKTTNGIECRVST